VVEVLMRDQDEVRLLARVNAVRVNVDDHVRALDEEAALDEALEVKVTDCGGLRQCGPLLGNASGTRDPLAAR
jgi:hypothetical protein